MKVSEFLTYTSKVIQTEIECLNTEGISLNALECSDDALDFRQKFAVHMSAANIMESLELYDDLLVFTDIYEGGGGGELGVFCEIGGLGGIGGL